jgi:anti-sigma B factor antagonist
METALELSVSIRHDVGNASIIEVGGEVDVYTSPRLKEALASVFGRQPHIVVNLEAVTYIDSTGLGVLVGVLKRVREQDGRLALICSNARLKRLFDLTGLVKVFDIYGDERSALHRTRVARREALPTPRTASTSAR